MAFLIKQKLDDVQYHYDRKGDILYLSFGPAVPAVTLAVEDWFLIRLTPDGLRMAGLTVVGFKRLFSKIRPDLIEELPERVERLKKACFFAQYTDETDSATFRFEEEQPAYYERLAEDIYVERALLGGDIVGFKLTHYTERGAETIERLLSAILNALFAPQGTPPTPADALTRAFFAHLDFPKLLKLAA
jgi:hypothetical protein